jgi:hypothetical protein
MLEFGNLSSGVRTQILEADVAGSLSMSSIASAPLLLRLDPQSLYDMVGRKSIDSGVIFEGEFHR